MNIAAPYIYQIIRDIVKMNPRFLTIFTEYLKKQRKDQVILGIRITIEYLRSCYNCVVLFVGYKLSYPLCEEFQVPLPKFWLFTVIFGFADVLVFSLLTERSIHIFVNFLASLISTILSVIIYCPSFYSTTQLTSNVLLVIFMIVTSFFLTYIAKQVYNNSINYFQTKANEKLYKELYDEAPNIFITVRSNDLKIINCNNTAIRETGYSTEELRDVLFPDLFDHSSQYHVREFFQNWHTKNFISNRTEQDTKRKKSIQISDAPGAIHVPQFQINDSWISSLLSSSPQNYITEGQKCKISDDIYQEDQASYWKFNQSVNHSSANADLSEKLKSDTSSTAIPEVDTREEENYELKMFKKDGSEMFVSLTVSPIYRLKNHLGSLKHRKNEDQDNNYNIEGYSIIVHDITTRKLLLDQAKSANMAKSNFISKVSHEFRNPLHGIIGIVDLLYDKIEAFQIYNAKDTEETSEYLNTIRQLSELLLTLISDILDISKIESNKIVMDEKPMDLKLSAQRVISCIEATADKNINFILDVDPSLPCDLLGDEKYISQVLLNLVGNAEKFTESGHIKLIIRSPENISHNCKNFDQNCKFCEMLNEITSKKKDNDCYIYICCEDTGIGIKDDDVKHLFKRFSQLSSPQTKKKGSGLGLYITKELIELMSGQIWIESKYGSGTKFHFYIKLRQSTVPEKELTQENIQAFEDNCNKEQMNSNCLKASGELAKNFKILIVDDSNINRTILRKLLQSLGFNSISVSKNGREAIEQVCHKGKHFDLIICDYFMPDMDGPETARHIRQYERYQDQKNRIQIVGLTASVDKSVYEKCIEAGMNDCLTKPLNRKQLKEFMEKTIRSTVFFEKKFL